METTGQWRKWGTYPGGVIEQQVCNGLVVGSRLVGAPVDVFAGAEQGVTHWSMTPSGHSTWDSKDGWELTRCHAPSFGFVPDEAASGFVVIPRYTCGTEVPDSSHSAGKCHG